MKGLIGCSDTNDSMKFLFDYLRETFFYIQNSFIPFVFAVQLNKYFKNNIGVIS